MKKMTQDDIVEYIRNNTDIFPKSETIHCREISDGNINYVYRLEDSFHRSVIVKYAHSEIRTSGNPLSTDRSRIESSALLAERKMAGDCVPAVYRYDRENCLLIMEDLYDYENLRHALMERKCFPGLALDLASFLVYTLLLSTDLVLDPMEKKARVGEFINPSLCRITERLVFREPYDEEQNTNILDKENEAFYIKELYRDTLLHREVAKLKHIFQTKAQSLLHGDLHTGSVFVKENATKILDPEFAFYGPAGYDIGNVLANLIFAWARSVCGDDRSVCGDDRGESFEAYVEETVSSIVDTFRIEGVGLLKERGTDRMARAEGFAEYVVADMLADGAGMCGTELIRRIVGDAKVKDITTIADDDARAAAQRMCVRMGKEFIMNRARYECGDDYRRLLARMKKEGRAK